MAVARVENRVKEGRHDVPPEDVRRRYQSGVRNLFRIFRAIADSWWLLDASRLPPPLIAIEEDLQLVVKRRRLYQRIQQQSEKEHGKAD
jgi:predicted ABC-type ATPase